MPGLQAQNYDVLSPNQIGDQIAKERNLFSVDGMTFFFTFKKKQDLLAWLNCAFFLILIA